MTAIYGPALGRKAAKIDHGREERQHHRIHPLEALGDLGYFFEEVGIDLFLRGCAPGYPESEQVGENRKADMEG
jgi:hypothetical protein